MRPLPSRSCSTTLSRLRSFGGRIRLWHSTAPLDLRSAGFAAEAVAVPWMVLGAAARFGAHFVSGIVFFGSNAPAGTPVWIFSALYNLSYVVPSLGSEHRRRAVRCCRSSMPPFRCELGQAGETVTRALLVSAAPLPGTCALLPRLLPMSTS